MNPFAFEILGEVEYIRLNLAHETEPKAPKSAAGFFQNSVAEYE
jgi:hypothetical protein